MEVTEQSQLRRELPDLRVGSNVRVNYRITEGNKERIQAFEGVIIANMVVHEIIRPPLLCEKLHKGMV